MNTLIIEANYDAILYLVLAIMFGPAMLLAIIGFAVKNHNKKTAKILFILAVIYVIVSLGICGSMML
jgi:heme O synthase-like polyprenyltransferase